MSHLPADFHRRFEQRPAGEPPTPESFTVDQVRCAINQFLDFGDQQLGQGQQGYFSGRGWAARCLRWHLATLAAPAALIASERHNAIIAKHFGADVAGACKAQDVLREVLATPPAPAQPLRGIAEVGAQIPGGCYCPPDRCQAPVIMGMQAPCLRRTTQPAEGRQAAAWPEFRSALQQGLIAGDGKPCPNNHDPDCRWPQCVCREREAAARATPPDLAKGGAA